MFNLKPHPDKLLILLYHGVSNEISRGAENKGGKHLDRSIFIEHLKYIKNNFNPISMDQVVSREWPKYPIAITFDDGFENNYTIAAPLLNDFNIPTTFYLTSGIIDTNIMFWVDIIEDCINLTKIDDIIININNEVIVFKLGEYKYESICSIKKYCKFGSIDQKNKILEQIINQTGITPKVTDALNYRKLNWAQVKEMHDNLLFTIGGHSLYHDILSQMDDEQLTLDIQTSIGLLNYNLNTKIKHYSYPEGLSNHYDQRVMDLLKLNGIICSPTAISGLNTKNTNLFELYRYMV